VILEDGSSKLLQKYRIYTYTKVHDIISQKVESFRRRIFRLLDPSCVGSFDDILKQEKRVNDVHDTGSLKSNSELREMNGSCGMHGLEEKCTNNYGQKSWAKEITVNN
jgi:hypothetical protein